MGFRLARVGFASIILALLLAGSARGEDGALDLRLRDLGGEPHNLQSYRGKIVVLNFWATWCGPCAEEMPLLVKAQKRYNDRGVVVIGVSLDEGSARAAVEKFAKNKKIDFPLWVGGTVEDLKQFGPEAVRPG